MDPMLSGNIGWAVVGIVVLKAVLAFTALLVAVILMVWFERKFIGDMQNRIGPNKAGPFGLLQTVADGLKLAFKEDLLPDRADKVVFRLAPFLAVVPAFGTFAIIPLAGNFNDGSDGVVSVFGYKTFVQVADPQFGILLMLAFSGIAVYGVMLAGWSSGSKYPLLGSVRASAQMVSYEAALGLSIASLLLAAVDQRHRRWPGHLELEPVDDRPGSVHRVLHRRHRRAQPASVRLCRGGAGVGRRV